MNEKPLVSVLTPSYNQNRWLRFNLESVEAQTYGNIEHIVVDGGSSDGTVDILKSSISERLSWISEPDEGQSDALNKALSMSRGEIVAWLNSDDSFADSRTIEWVVDAFRENPKADIIYGHVVDTDENGLALRLTWSPPFWTSKLAPGINPAKQPGAFFRRSAISQEFVKKDLHYSMDHELFLRLVAEGDGFRRISKILATNRHQPQRKSLARPPQYFIEHARYYGSGRFARIRTCLVSRTVSTLCRVRGIANFLLIPRTARPVGDLKFPGFFDRFKLQTLAITEREIEKRKGARQVRSV